MPCCVIKKCKNTSRTMKNSTGLSFHRFPREPVLRSKWIQLLSKSRDDEYWDPSPYCVVCSIHFEDTQWYFTKSGLRRLRENAIPTKDIFPINEICEVCDSSEEDLPAKSTNKPICFTKAKSTLSPEDSVKSTNRLSPKVMVKETDPNSIFDSVEVVKLKKQLKRQRLLRLATKSRLRCLQQKVRRLKNRNETLKTIIKDLGYTNLLHVNCTAQCSHCNKKPDLSELPEIKDETFEGPRSFLNNTVEVEIKELPIEPKIEITERYEEVNIQIKVEPEDYE